MSALALAIISDVKTDISVQIRKTISLA